MDRVCVFYLTDITLIYCDWIGLWWISFILCSRDASDDARCSSHDARHAPSHAWNAPRVRPYGPLWIITFLKPALKFPTIKKGVQNSCRTIFLSCFFAAWCQWVGWCLPWCLECLDYLPVSVKPLVLFMCANTQVFGHHVFMSFSVALIIRLNCTEPELQFTNILSSLFASWCSQTIWNTLISCKYSMTILSFSKMLFRNISPLLCNRQPADPQQFLKLISTTNLEIILCF